MLFVLVMDVLNSLISKASDLGLFKALSNRGPSHRLSLYADDVVLFIQPTSQEMELARAILEKFGDASGLHANLQKSSAIPIQCDSEDLALIEENLPCPAGTFPCTYLGLPLSNRKLRASELLPLVEKVADKLPGWKAGLIHKAGRIILVRMVLTAIPIHVLIALDIPKWVIRAIDKKRRAFLWKGRDSVNGGNCLVSWDKVCRPLDLGGLGILNLEVLGWALRMRWLWFQKTDPERPWSELQLSFHANTTALFSISVTTQIGHGDNTLFWSDRWLHGQPVIDLAPNLTAAVRKRVISQRTVAQALSNQTWVRDIQGALSLEGLQEYLLLWDLLQEVDLNPEADDVHIWKHKVQANTLPSRLIGLSSLGLFPLSHGSGCGGRGLP
uniref:Uncharacterized protein n=1 Tax=Arundo donax TaxID=35708 RepID=A0A0A8XQ40_ARUDO